MCNRQIIGLYTIYFVKLNFSYFLSLQLRYYFIYIYAYMDAGCGIWKQDPETNIWAQQGLEYGVEKVPQWGAS